MAHYIYISKSSKDYVLAQLIELNALQEMTLWQRYLLLSKPSWVIIGDPCNGKRSCAMAFKSFKSSLLFVISYNDAIVADFMGSCIGCLQEYVYFVVNLRENLTKSCTSETCNLVNRQTTELSYFYFEWVWKFTNKPLSVIPIL